MLIVMDGMTFVIIPDRKSGRWRNHKRPGQAKPELQQQQHQHQPEPAEDGVYKALLPLFEQTDTIIQTK